eukprot:Hpha_TRINITY_DN23690_c0_g1::TRINITY_DN23690_c0_g1_i1::g.57486::m.57486
MVFSTENIRKLCPYWYASNFQKRSHFCVSIDNNDLRDFVERDAFFLNWNLVLVITRTAHDTSVPHRNSVPGRIFYRAILNNPWIRHVFSVFYVGLRHPKVTPIPIAFGKFAGPDDDVRRGG